MFSFLKRSSPALTFWDWFRANATRIETLPEYEVKPLLELGNELHRIDRGLTYRIINLGDGRHELQVSADGEPMLIPVVSSLVEQAPEFPNWRILAFRQPSPEPMSIPFEDRILTSENVRFSVDRIVQRSEMADLTIALDDFVQGNANHLAHCTMLLMESLIGEYDLMTCIGDLEYLDSSEVEPEAFHPLSALPELIQDLKLGLGPSE